MFDSVKTGLGYLTLSLLIMVSKYRERILCISLMFC